MPATMRCATSLSALAGAIEAAGDVDRDGRVGLVASETGGAPGVHGNPGGGRRGERIRHDGINSAGSA